MREEYMKLNGQRAHHSGVLRAQGHGPGLPVAGVTFQIGKAALGDFT